MAAILNSANLHSAILVFSLKLTHTCQDWFPLFAQKNLDSLILTQLDDCNYLEICHPQFSHFVQKILHSIHSDSTWWWQPSWSLPSWIQPFCTKRTSLVHPDSTWWWQPSWILPCWIHTLPSWIQTPCYLLSDSLKNTLPPFWFWLKLIQSDWNSFILNERDDGSHLEICHRGFRHLVIFS